MEEKCLDLKLSDTIIIFDSATTKGVKIENKNHQLIVTKVNEVKDGNTKIRSLNEETIRCLFYLEDFANHCREQGLSKELNLCLNQLLDYFYSKKQGATIPKNKIIKQELLQNIIIFEDDFVNNK